jgi:hypothetical protein
MSSLRTTLLIVACVLSLSLSSGLASNTPIELDSGVQPLDTYDLIRHLRDTLAAIAESGSGSTASIALIDSMTILELADFFPSSLKNEHDRLVWEIDLPPHKYMPTSPISFVLSIQPDRQYQVSDVVTELSEGLEAVQGSIAKDYLAQNSTALCDFLHARITLYRSLMLPVPLWHELSTGGSGDMIVHGRDVDTVRYNDRTHILLGLHRIGKDLWCYADIVSLKTSDNTATARYILIVTAEGAKGNHLADIVETIEQPLTDSPEISSMVVHLYPFVRMDNVADLMKQATDSAGQKQWEVHLRRDSR